MLGKICPHYLLKLLPVHLFILRYLLAASLRIYNRDMIIDADVARRAADHLKANDPVLRPVIEAVGPCPLRPHTDYYRELVDSIISQQLSVNAAAA